MSQQKVDKYKEYKANKSKIIKKEKRRVRVEIIAIAAVFVGLVGWFAFSFYGRVEATSPPKEYQIDSGAVDKYLNDLHAPVEEATDTDEEADTTEEQ